MEKHQDGYVAYPLGLKGIIVGRGGTCEEALADVKSAIRFHIETFGDEVLETVPARWRGALPGQHLLGNSKGDVLAVHHHHLHTKKDIT